MAYHVVNFSGGKDSTAMLLHMIELEMQIDEIIFCDTGAEYPQTYAHIDRVEEYIKRPITRLKAEHDFEWYLLHKETRPIKKDGVEKPHRYGYSWPSAINRWCTTTLKVNAMKTYFKGRKLERIDYIGIAADEQKRIRDKVYPLVEWGWTEADCLKYCYEKGFDWGGLYNIFSRISCWCCPLQRIDEFRRLRKHFPDLWSRLLEWDKQSWRRFNKRFSVEDLDRRFAAEEDAAARQGCLFEGGV